MATERTRAIGPDDAVIPLPYPTPSSSSSDEPNSKNGNRSDNRSRDQFRETFMRAGVSSQASGSAYIEMNNTKVMCTVYGPRQTTKTQEFSEEGQLFCDFKYASFSCEGCRKGFASDAEEKENSIIMGQALDAAIMFEKFPKSAVEVYVLVIQNDGGALPAAITCASLALANAGIEMYDLVASCSAVYLERAGVILDPTTLEEKEGSGRVTIARLPSLNLISQVMLDGELDQASVTESTDLCVDGCDKLYSVMRETLIQTIKK
eukprot:TRINITY_DN5694_c0_g1_i1.p1 TRINITY_DN5694_c0_g1~~TRINITY_DN5694_c0_g1_i1.p1  ORF type:complete len:263 (-),score=85.13 TRINITY_DN5694_c0_g1_i1:6-794(-)